MWLEELVYGDASSVVVTGLGAAGCLWPPLRYWYICTAEVRKMIAK